MKKYLLCIFLFSSPVYSYTITHNDYVDKAPVTALGQNTNENTIYALINGNLDSTNFISTASIQGNQIANNTITYSNKAANASTQIIYGAVGTSSSKQSSIIAAPSIQTVGGTVVISAVVYYQCSSGNTDFIDVTNGSNGLGGAAFSERVCSDNNYYTVNFYTLDVGEPAGNYTYNLSYSGHGTIRGYSIMLVELRN